MGNFISIIAIPLGILMRAIHQVVGSYGLTLILFALITKILMFPLSIKQQKSTAKQAAYQPMINEIMKKYEGDRERQTQEYQKLQEELGFSPTAGCLPLLVQLPIMFGLIDVIYKPLQHILQIPADVVLKATEIAQGLATLPKYGAEPIIIELVKKQPELFSAVFTPDKIQAIQGFNQTMFGMDLSRIPTLTLEPLLIIPVLSAVSMLVMQFLTTKLNGMSDQMQGSMKYMPYMASLMFIWFGFTIPAGVSLYWIASNLFGLVQALILHKMYNPAEYKAQLAAELEEKRRLKREQKKAGRIVAEQPAPATAASGGKALPPAEPTLSESEQNRLRLERARKMDEERYKS